MDLQDRAIDALMKRGFMYQHTTPEGNQVYSRDFDNKSQWVAEVTFDGLVNGMEVNEYLTFFKHERDKLQKRSSHYKG